MKETKKITLSAMLVALGAALMALGGVVEVFDLTVCALASLLVAFVYIELGSPYTWLVWICTSLVSFIIFPASLLWLEYFLIFGIYPIIKGYIERLKRGFWLILKLAFGTVMTVVLILCAELVTGAPFFETDLQWLTAVLCALVVVAFILYDFFLTVLIRFYMTKLRKRFQSFLK